MGEEPAASLCFCLPHTRARALAVTQHVSLLIRLCHIAIPRRCPSMFLRALQHFPRGPFNHVYWRINLYFPSDGRPLIVCRRRSSGERCTLGKKTPPSERPCGKSNLLVCGHLHVIGEMGPLEMSGGQRRMMEARGCCGSFPTRPASKCSALQRGKIKDCTVSVCTEPRANPPQLRLA